MIKTEFTRLVGCDVPIQQSPMGKGTSTPSLASAVANAGGLGMLSLTGYSGEVIEKIVQDTYALTSKKVGANFLLYQPIDIETVKVAAGLLDVVDFFWGKPDKKLVDVAKKAGAITSWQVGSLEEALLAEEVGCDFITVQSIEAGGHVRGTIDIFALLDQVIGAVNIPVLACGGVGSGESLAAVLAAGAAGWPDAPHRVLRSSLDAAMAFEGDYVGTSCDPITGDIRNIPKYAAVELHKGISGHIEAMPHWAGQTVECIKKRQSVSEIINEIIDDAQRAL